MSCFLVAGAASFDLQQTMLGDIGTSPGGQAEPAPVRLSEGGLVGTTARFRLERLGSR